MNLSRREFLATAVLSTAALSLEAQATAKQRLQCRTMQRHAHPKPERPKVPRVPAVLSRVTGTAGLDAAFASLKSGQDTLHAALQVRKLRRTTATMIRQG